MDIGLAVILLCWLTTGVVDAFSETPKFSQLKLMYPGYLDYGGKYKDHDIIQHVLGVNQDNNYNIITDKSPEVIYITEHKHHTAALRMSWTLNRYSGRHSLGNSPLKITAIPDSDDEEHTQLKDSITGASDENQYIFSNTAFGPYLASKYGNPVVAKFKQHFIKDTSQLLLSKDLNNNKNSLFYNKQGIIRLVSYHKDHAGGHIALWDCDHFFQSPDWSKEHHVIGVEFWESPDSYCPEKVTTKTEQPHYVKPDPSVKIIARHNFHETQIQDVNTNHLTNNKNTDTKQFQTSRKSNKKTAENSQVRHAQDKRNKLRTRHDKQEEEVVKEVLWMQEET